MRIATSTIYEQQTASIDNLSSAYNTVGNQLSTGKSLNVPSDDPSVVSQDLTITNTINAENSDASNASAATNQLTNTDSILSSVTSLLQEARSLAVEGATDIIPNGTQRPLIGKQVSGILQQAIALANSQYGDTYVFAGTGEHSSAPVQANGTPPTGVTFSGNLNTQTEQIDGQTVDVGTTLQQAFNYDSPDGTPDVFQVLANLANTLDNEPASTSSAASVNVAGQVIVPSGANATTLGTPGGPNVPPTVANGTDGPMTTVPLKADNASTPTTGPSYYSIQINGTSPTTAAVGSAIVTFTSATVMDDTTSPGQADTTSVVGLINEQTATTGVVASWNAQTQRLTLTSTAPNSPPFNVTDIATPANGSPTATPTTTPPGLPATGATNTGNFVEAFQLSNTGSVVTNLSTQLYDIDQVTNAVLAGRAQIGQTIQNLASTNSQLQAESTDNTSTKSGYEDTNIAQATSQFSLIQTALQGAYSTTTRLESKTLLDYLPA